MDVKAAGKVGLILFRFLNDEVRIEVISLLFAFTARGGCVH